MATKKYRTDILIKQQFEYLSQLETKLYENVEFMAKHGQLKRIIDVRADDLNRAVSLLVALDDEDERSEDKAYDDVIDSYRVNLIRCGVIQRLETELVYARAVLAKAVKKQKNLAKARQRVEWLENEIENLIMSNKSIEFPFKKSFKLDTSLKIEKKSIYEDLNISKWIEEENDNLKLESEAKHEDKKAEVGENLNEPEEELLQLVFKWDKKSTGSTDSLLRSSSDEDENETKPSNLNETISNEKIQNKNLTDIIKAESNMNQNLEKLDDIKDEHKELDNDEQSNIHSETVEPNKDDDIAKDETKEEKANLEEIKSPMIQSEYEPSLNLDRTLSEFSLKSKTHKREADFREEKKYPSWQKVHLRYEVPAYSKKLTSLDPTSYHRLALALTESEIDSGLVNGTLENFSGKQSLDYTDVEFIKLASFIQNVSKRVCSDSHEFSYGKQKLSVDEFSQTQTVKINTNEVKLLESRRSARNKPMLYQSPNLLPSTSLALARTNKSQYFPRPASAFISSKNKTQLKIQARTSLDSSYKPSLIANQHNLKEKTKLMLYHRPIKKPSTVPNDFNFGHHSSSSLNLNSEIKIVKNRTSRIPPLLSWSDIKPDASPCYHSGLKFERIKSLLTTNLNSESFEEKRDAIKHLGLLKIADNSVTYALNNLLNNQKENEIIRFESAMSLVALGDWNENACKILSINLKSGNRFIQNEILHCIINSKNPQFTDLELIKNLENLIRIDNEKMRLEASICIGKLNPRKTSKSIVEAALSTLLNIAEVSSDWSHKSMALQAIVKLFMSKKENKIVDMVLRLLVDAIERASDWTVRCSAAKLLSHLGAERINASKLADTIFHVLNDKLSQDPIREVRLCIGETILDLNLYAKIYSNIFNLMYYYIYKSISNLESPDENLRAKAVMSIEMLGVVTKKIIEKLVDMLELESSDYVRTVILKALMYLSPRNQKLAHALSNLGKNSKLLMIMNRIQEQNKIKT